MRASQKSLADPDNWDRYAKFTTKTVNRGNKDAVTCVCITEGFITIVLDSSLQGVCGNYMRYYLLRTIVTIVVSFLVTMINFMLKIVFRKLAKFERYKSLTHETNSIFKKLFIAVFINMAILLLLINANFQEFEFVKNISNWLPIGGDLFFNGKYNDLKRAWYPRVGLAFLVLVISTVFSNMFSSAQWELIRMYKRNIVAKKQLLQCDMNLQMNGGFFEIDAKYSISLAVIFTLILDSSFV